MRPGKERWAQLEHYMVQTQRAREEAVEAEDYRGLFNEASFCIAHAYCMVWMWVEKVEVEAT